jgi:transketolase
MRPKRTLPQILIDISYKANACHIGSALSCIDLVDKLLKKKGIFVFSKASGVGAYYACLVNNGKMTEEQAVEMLKKYPLPNKETGLVWSGGSLGHGLPVAVGLALGNKKKQVYVLMSDGECQEGTTWECLLFARQHKLKNLHIYIDNNGLQACGATKDILDIPFKQLKKIFPINVVKTIKGQGVDFMENNYVWHYKNLKPKLYAKAIYQLSNRVGKKR